MSRIALSLILVFNSFALASCSGYTTASVPTSPDSEVTAESSSPTLKRGQRVRVHLRSGEMREGDVVEVSDTQVTLAGEAEGRDVTEHSYKFADIEKCEIQTVTDGGAAVAVLFGVVIVSFAILVAIIAADPPAWN